MRKRPSYDAERAFLEKARGDRADQQLIKEDLHTFVSPQPWPLDDIEPYPSMPEGSFLRKPMSLPLKEKEWNAIERHTKALGVSKSTWIRHAIFKLMEEEQWLCFRRKKSDHE